jgi:hypothetical protein
MPCRCLNCPDKPEFETHSEFVIHWNSTHTVAPTTTIELPPQLKPFFPEVASKKVELHEEFTRKEPIVPPPP